MNRARRYFLLLSLTAFAPESLWGQVMRGTPRFGSYSGGPLDVINLANLNSHIRVPVVHKPGRGVDFNYDLAYDTSVWYPVGSVGNQTWQPVYNWGWHGQTETVTGWLSYSLYVFIVYCGQYGGTSMPVYQYYNFSYIDQWGMGHTFYSKAYWSNGACSSVYTPPSGSSFSELAADGSGLTLRVSVWPFSNPPVSATVGSPDGKVVTPPTNSPAGAGSASNPNGNYISGDSAGHFTDTLGQTVLTISGAAPNDTTFTYTTSTGATAAYTMHYATRTVRTGFACPGVSEYGPTSVSLVDYIQLPNGNKYTFQYELTPNQGTYPGAVTGRLASVTLPTGGSITYTYTGANYGIKCADGSTLNMTRVVNDGAASSTWIYARTGSTTTVTHPQLPYDSAASQTVLTFDSNNLETSRKIYQGSATGTPLRTINTTWAANKTPTSQVLILEDGLTQSKTETTYDSHGNLTVLKEHDFGMGSPGPLRRTTTTTYLAGPNYDSRYLFDRVTSQTVSDGTGAVKSRVDIAYDVYNASHPMTCRSTPIPGFNASYSCTLIYRGNPTSVITYTDPVTPSGATTRYIHYDQLGNVMASDLNCCQKKTWTFSTTTQYAYPDSITLGSSAPQLTTSATYELNMGLTLTWTDPNNKVTTSTYDALGRITDMLRPDNHHVITVYDDTNRTVQVTSPVQGTDVVREKTYFDGFGRPITRQLLDAGNASYSIVETQYDALGRVYKTSNPHNGTAQYWTEIRYDALGRVVKTILPDGGQTTTVYSLNTVTTTDSVGKQRKSQGDALGRQVIVFEPDVSNNNSLTQQTSYTYNVLDQLLTVTQGVQTRTYNYDGLGRLTSVATPEAGTVSYQYNSYDLLTQRTDARGVITTYGYDSLNRVTSTSYNVGSTGVTATPTVTLTYGTNSAQNNNGRLLTITDGPGSETYAYDLLGRVAQLQKVISGTTYATSYQYNLASGLTQITYPSGRVVEQAYDAIGRLCRVGGTNGASCTATSPFASGFGYNPASQVTAFNYGNGVAASLGYSADRLQLTSLSYTKSPTTLLNLSYNYAQGGGNNGQITSITDNTGTQEAGRSVTYTYDTLHRLSSAVTTGSTAYPQWGLAWSYDRYANRLNQNQTYGNPPTNSLSFANTPGAGAYTNRPDNMCFDANGNLMTETPASPCPPPAPTYKYDAENRLVDYLVSTAYAYDGNGVRVKKCAPNCASPTSSTVYIYSGGQVIAEYDNGAPVGSPTREYIYSGGQFLATIQGATTTYHHADHLSVRVSTDSNGSTVRAFAHYPFGEAWYETGTASKWKFTTYERDSESNNDFAMARHYIYRFGRFPSTDPLAGDTADPQSLNLYAYTVNDPINLVDPSGACYSPFTSSGCSPVDPLSKALLLYGAYCTVDNVIVDCRTAYGLLGSGAALVCPNNLCSPFTRAQDGVIFEWRRDWGLSTAFLIKNDAGQVIRRIIINAIVVGKWVPVGNARISSGLRYDLETFWLQAKVFLQSMQQAQTDAWNEGYYSCIAEGLFVGATAPALTHAFGEAATQAAGRSATSMAGAYYHFKDGRFTAWGRSSKVLVPRAAGAIKSAAKSLNLVGWAVFDAELAHTIYKCSDRLR